MNAQHVAIQRSNLKSSTVRIVRTTDSRHGLPVAENVLDRDFDPTAPNTAWSADITYIPTADGWLCLAVVEDLFSRMIVGWAMDATMTSRLVVDALEMAIRRRLPPTIPQTSVPTEASCKLPHGARLGNGVEPRRVRRSERRADRIDGRTGS